MNLTTENCRKNVNGFSSMCLLNIYNLSSHVSLDNFSNKCVSSDSSSINNNNSLKDNIFVGISLKQKPQK